MKRITIQAPELVAQVFSWSERDNRKAPDVVRLLMELGLKEAERLGVLVAELSAEYREMSARIEAERRAKETRASSPARAHFRLVPSLPSDDSGVRREGGQQ